MPKKRKSFSSRLGPPTTYLVQCPHCDGQGQFLVGYRRRRAVFEKCRYCKNGKIKKLAVPSTERIRVIERMIEELQAEKEAIRKELKRLSSPYVRF